MPACPRAPQGSLPRQSQNSDTKSTGPAREAPSRKTDPIKDPHGPIGISFREAVVVLFQIIIITSRLVRGVGVDGLEFPLDLSLRRVVRVELGHGLALVYCRPIRNCFPAGHGVGWCQEQGPEEAHGGGCPSCFHGLSPITWVWAVGGCSRRRRRALEPTVLSCPAVRRRAGSVQGLLAGERRAMASVTEGPGASGTASAVARCVEYRFC